MRVLIVLGVILIAGCAGTRPAPAGGADVPFTTDFRPLNKKYKSDKDMQAARDIDWQSCRAQSLALALGVQDPQRPAQVNQSVNIQAAPIYPANGAYQPLPQPVVPDWQEVIDARKAAEREQQKQAMAKSALIGCMGNKGWSFAP
jgi:hypothetical protein